MANNVNECIKLEGVSKSVKDYKKDLRENLIHSWQRIGKPSQSLALSYRVHLGSAPACAGVEPNLTQYGFWNGLPQNWGAH